MTTIIVPAQKGAQGRHSPDPHSTTTIAVDNTHITFVFESYKQRAEFWQRVSDSANKYVEVVSE